ncbi:hypothetical protein OH77DRAFT_642023 [Trametes cingulata]|nr:hypothetical protein OH77DRAFT_642023 [Trametes cingulata]
MTLPRKPLLPPRAGRSSPTPLLVPQPCSPYVQSPGLDATTFDRSSVRRWTLSPTSHARARRGGILLPASTPRQLGCSTRRIPARPRIRIAPWRAAPPRVPSDRLLLLVREATLFPSRRCLLGKPLPFTRAAHNKTRACRAAACLSSVCTLVFSSASGLESRLTPAGSSCVRATRCGRTSAESVPSPSRLCVVPRRITNGAVARDACLFSFSSGRPHGPVLTPHALTSPRPVSRPGSPLVKHTQDPAPAGASREGFRRAYY